MKSLKQPILNRVFNKLTIQHSKATVLLFSSLFLTGCGSLPLIAFEKPPAALIHAEEYEVKVKKRPQYQTQTSTVTYTRFPTQTQQLNTQPYVQPYVQPNTQPRTQPVILSYEEYMASVNPYYQPQKTSTATIKVDVTTEEDHKKDIEQEFHSNVWDEMHNNFFLTKTHFGEFDSNISYFKKRPALLNRVSKRAKPFLHYILTEVQKRNMPYEIALLPIIESSFRPIARSHQAAGGLWQFIPSTAHLYGLDQNWWFDGRQDAVQSTQAALDYLQKLYKQNNNDWLLALASYNGGIGNVRKAIRKYKKRHKQPKSKPSFWDIQPYLLRETRHYVPQLLGVSHVIDKANAFKIPLEPIQNEPFFTEVKLDKQTTLRKVARLSGISESLLGNLNAGYLRPTTPPKGPFHLLLPVDNAKTFKEAITRNTSLFDIQWIKHVIKSGESLSVIADKYNTSSSAIKNINGMRNSRIRTGKTLLIPIPKEYAKQLKSFTNRNKYKGPKKTHTVKAGDSIWSIARYYNVDTRTLCMWNRIGIRSPLRKGQKLEIRSAKYGHKLEVPLKKGQSLWTLSKKYNVTTTELIRWNNIQKSKSIRPGTLLTIWQPKSVRKSVRKTTIDANAPHRNYKVRSGDNLWTIARRNSLSTKALASYNNLSINGFLKLGQVLKIPLES